MAERVGEGVEEAARGHEGVRGGDGEVEEGGGGVLLERFRRGVEGFGEVRDCAEVGNDEAAVWVVLGYQPELR